MKQILYKDIPQNIYRKGWSFTFPSGCKDIYFKLDRDLTGDKELCEVVKPIKHLPTGLVHIEALGQYNYLRVSYYPEKITEENIINFMSSLKLE